MKMTLDKKLGKLKMPSKGAPQDLSDAPEADEGSPEEEASESPDEEAAEGDDSSSGPDTLKAVSDDDLLAEVKKRGLESKLGSGAPDESGDDQSNYA